MSTVHVRVCGGRVMGVVVGGALDMAIDNLLYQSFLWQPAEQGQSATMHFAPVYFINLL